MSQGPRTIHVDQLQVREGTLWARLPLVGIVLGAVGVGSSFAIGSSNPDQLYHSWLVAFLYVLSFGVGALFFVLLLHATKGGWGVVIRRLGEHIMATLPMVGLLFIPVALGLGSLFHWSDPEAVAHDHLLQGKAPWLNTTGFFVRAAAYFAIWSLIALWFRSRSIRQDSSGDHAITRRMIFWAGPAVIVSALTVTAASFDWAMSLDAHWYSTIFGVYYFAGSLVGVFALLVLLSGGLEEAGYLKKAITTEHFHDLGKLLYAFSVFWAYIAFSQFFLIWYANIPEETIFYLHRWEGSWKPLSILLAVGHFVMPFFLLMPRTIKRKRGLLMLGAVWMLVMHFIDMYWLVMPNLHPHGVHFSLVDVTTLMGAGGLFLAALGWFLRGSKLVPIRDPRLVESLSFQNF